MVDLDAEDMVDVEILQHRPHFSPTALCRPSCAMM
jgi:hypothetical protein